MRMFSNQDIEDYYDQTEVHYRMHWKLEEGMGLHYGIWDDTTKNLSEAVLNSNKQLMELGGIGKGHLVLDAGCGIGGSSIYLAKMQGCQVKGITLSKKQQQTATNLAKEKGVSDKVEFSVQDYTNTYFPDNTFDYAWCIESMQTATDKRLFFKEMSRIIKPGGSILVADIFKPEWYDITKEKDMLTMLNGWAMSDFLCIDELYKMSEEYKFSVDRLNNVSKEVYKSVKRMYYAGLVGAIGTKAYNLFYNASPFSKTHYKTGIAQKRGYDRNLWGYYQVRLINNK